MNTSNNITKFEAGKTYFCRSVCDSECVFGFLVVRRTETSVWVVDNTELASQPQRRKIEVYNGVESIYPNGKYSMAPILRAA